MNIELHYGAGRHGGPYPDLESAIESATRLIHGNKNERYIYARKGVNGKLLAVIKKDKNSDTGVLVIRYL